MTSPGGSKSGIYSSWVDDVFPDHHPSLTVRQLAPPQIFKQDFKADCLFDLNSVQGVLAARHWRSSSAAELESTVYSATHVNTSGNEHIRQPGVGMSSSAGHEACQGNCHTRYYSAKKCDHHHIVGSLGKDLVVADLRPHETVGAFGQEEEDDDDEETKSDLAKPLSSYISTAVDDAPARELIKEIATVELEVAKLEKHLLLLYRSSFLRKNYDAPSNSVDTQEDIVSTALTANTTPLPMLDVPAKQSSCEHDQYISTTSLQRGKKETPVYRQQNNSFIDYKGSSKTNIVPFWNSLDSHQETASSPCYSSQNSYDLCSLYSQPLSSSITLGNETWSTERRCQDMIPYFNSREGHTLCDDDAYSKVLSNNKHNDVVHTSDQNTILLTQRGNKLSEDLIQCMAAIYCRLAEPSPPLMLHTDHHHHYHGSKSSHCSSPTVSTANCAPSKIFSIQRFSASEHGWASNLQCMKGADGAHCEDISSSHEPNVHECSVHASDPCAQNTSASTFEVRSIQFDTERLSFVAEMLRTLRSLVKQLEEVNPGLMTHEQKLAFWINIHNALMMHAFLAFGIPHNDSKGILTSSSSLHHQRAAYKIGTQSIDAQTIQQVILKCQLPHRHRHRSTAKWLQSLDLLSPTRIRKVAKWRGAAVGSFAIDKAEPLVCFALCCGGRSDPTVRIYRENSIYQDLETAKRDFLHVHVNVEPNGRFVLPLILESFAKSNCMKPMHLLEWVVENVDPGTTRTIIPMQHMLRTDPRIDRRITWSRYDCTFCYVFVSSLCK